MPRAFGFHERETAVILKRVADERRTRPDVATRVQQDGYPFGDGEGVKWYKLTGNLDAGGTATAHATHWDRAANGGDGGYMVDTDETVTLKDLAGQHWGLEGEWIRAQDRRAGNGTVYEVLSAGATWHVATLDAELAAGGSVAATVSIDSASVTVTVHDLWLDTGDSLPAGQGVGITYDVHGGRWVDTETSCATEGTA